MKQCSNKWKNGYSIKTEQYRITKWGENGELGYEIYDTLNHQEMNNLANDTSRFILLDSLKKIIDARINEVNKVPDGIGDNL